jgi:hypothetical protein
VLTADSTVVAPRLLLPLLQQAASPSAWRPSCCLLRGSGIPRYGLRVRELVLVHHASDTDQLAVQCSMSNNIVWMISSKRCNNLRAFRQPGRGEGFHCPAVHMACKAPQRMAIRASAVIPGLASAAKRAGRCKRKTHGSAHSRCWRRTGMGCIPPGETTGAYHA